MTRMLSSVLTIVMALAVSVGDAEAQRIVPFAGGGLAKGMGDLSDGTDNGWVGYAGVTIPLPSLTPGLSFGVTGSYSRVPYTGTFNEATNTAALVGEIGYQIDATATVKPYLRAGLGAQLRKYDPGNTAFREQSEGKLALSGGAGVQFLVSSVALFVGAHVLTDMDAGILAIHGGIALPGRAR